MGIGGGSQTNGATTTEWTPSHAELFDAARRGDLVRIRLWLAAKLEKRRRRPRTPLSLLRSSSAARSAPDAPGWLATVREPASGQSCLHAPALFGDTTVCRLLLDADPLLAQVSDRRGCRSLHLAAFNGSLDVCKLLLDADPAGLDDKNGAHDTALHLAAQSGHSDVVRLLLSRQATADSLNARGESPAAAAARNGHVDVLRVLLAHRPELALDVSAAGATPLWIAAKLGHAECLDVLLEAGCNPNSLVSEPSTGNGLQSKNSTPLHEAALQGHASCVAALLRHGADLSLPDRQGRTVLHALDQALDNPESASLANASPAKPNRVGLIDCRRLIQEHMDRLVAAKQASVWRPIPSCSASQQYSMDLDETDSISESTTLGRRPKFPVTSPFATARHCRSKRVVGLSGSAIGGDTLPARIHLAGNHQHHHHQSSATMRPTILAPNIYDDDDREAASFSERASAPMAVIRHSSVQQQQPQQLNGHYRLSIYEQHPISRGPSAMQAINANANRGGYYDRESIYSNPRPMMSNAATALLSPQVVRRAAAEAKNGIQTMPTRRGNGTAAYFVRPSVFESPLVIAANQILQRSQNNGGGSSSSGNRRPDSMAPSASHTSIGTFACSQMDRSVSPAPTELTLAPVAVQEEMALSTDSTSTVTEGGEREFYYRSGGQEARATTIALSGSPIDENGGGGKQPYSTHESPSCTDTSSEPDRVHQTNSDNRNSTWGRKSGGAESSTSTTTSPSSSSSSSSPPRSGAQKATGQPPAVDSDYDFDEKEEWKKIDEIVGSLAALGSPPPPPFRSPVTKRASLASLPRADEFALTSDWLSAIDCSDCLPAFAAFELQNIHVVLSARLSHQCLTDMGISRPDQRARIMASLQPRIAKKTSSEGTSAYFTTSEATSDDADGASCEELSPTSARIEAQIRRELLSSKGATFAAHYLGCVEVSNVDSEAETLRALVLVKDRIGDGRAVQPVQLRLRPPRLAVESRPGGDEARGNSTEMWAHHASDLQLVERDPADRHCLAVVTRASRHRLLAHCYGFLTADVASEIMLALRFFRKMGGGGGGGAEQMNDK